MVLTESDFNMTIICSPNWSKEKSFQFSQKEEVLRSIIIYLFILLKFRIIITVSSNNESWIYNFELV